MELLEGLRFNYLFNGLTDAEFRRIAEKATIRDFEVGEEIVRQFDRSSDVMVLLAGSVRVSTLHGEKIAEGGPGSVIGEISLIDDKPRSATVKSLTHSRAAVIPARDLWKVLQEDPLIARKVLFNIAQVLCARLRSSNLHLDTLMGQAHSPTGD